MKPNLPHKDELLFCKDRDLWVTDYKEKRTKECLSCITDEKWVKKSPIKGKHCVRYTRRIHQGIVSDLSDGN